MKGDCLMAASQESVKPTHKELWHIVQGPGRQRSWRRFGAGFINRDGSINLIIDLFPGSHFQLRDPRAPEPVAEPEPEKKGRTVKLNRNKKAK
jgi:hypothetical protein